MPSGIGIGEVSALLTVLFTCLITIANILMWLSTRRTIQLQVASAQSLNYQSLIQSHRELMFGLISHPETLQAYALANGFDRDQWRLQILSTFFINHAWMHFVIFDHEKFDHVHLESFKRDAQEMFTWPSIQNRWQQAKVSYPENFRAFVEKELLTAPAAVDKKLGYSSACESNS